MTQDELDAWVDAEVACYMRTGDKARMRQVLREEARQLQRDMLMRSYAPVGGTAGTMLIAFGGLQQHLGGGRSGGVPPHEFVRTCEKAGARYSLFVKDPLRCWYCRGLGDGGGGSSGDNGGGPSTASSYTFEEMVEVLREEIRSVKPDRVMTIGSSMGGYAAVRAGLLLDANLAIAFSPQVLLTPGERQSAGLSRVPLDDNFEWLQLVSAVEGFEPTSLLDAVRRTPQTCSTQVILHVGTADENDVREAQMLRDEVNHRRGSGSSSGSSSGGGGSRIHLTLHLHADREHNLVVEMRDSGRLQALMRGWLHPCPSGAEDGARRGEEHARRVAALQAEFGMAGKVPSVASAQWDNRLLRRWFEAGGVLTMAAVNEVEEDVMYRQLLDLVGAELPSRELEPIDVGKGGLLGAAAAGDTATFDRLADCLACDGYVLADLLGHESDVWGRVCQEGQRLLPHMKPGILESTDGTVTSGKAPSGKARGDVYISASEAMVLAESSASSGLTLPALSLLDTALGVVGHALAPSIERHSELGHFIRLRTDPFFKCFPGDAAEYSAHFDGGQLAHATKLTAVLYCNEGWRAEDGGKLQLLDERAACWRSVTPHAGRLVFFLVKGQLHKVEPCYAPRFALTNWWMEPNYKPGQPRDMTVSVRSVYTTSGDPRRYERLPPKAAQEVLHGLTAIDRHRASRDQRGDPG